MKIKASLQLISVGKLKTPGLKEISDHYEKQIQHFCKFQQIEFKSPDKLKIPDESFLILLDEKGKTFDSLEFSKFLSKNSEQNKKIIFHIGAAYGHEDQLKNQAKECIAMAPFTLSHQVARIVFLEQLYRALTILNGHPYHND